MPPLPEFVKRYIHLNFNASLPTAAVKNRGMLTILRGAAGVRDKPQVARKNAADAYEWVELANTTDVAATYQPLDATLTAVAAYNTNGLLTQTAADTFTGRTIIGTVDQITVTNGSGVSGNPTLSIPDPFAVTEIDASTGIIQALTAATSFASNGTTTIGNAIGDLATFFGQVEFDGNTGSMTATPQTNAGTGATASINSPGSESCFTVSITMGTGAASGLVLSIGFGTARANNDYMAIPVPLNIRAHAASFRAENLQTTGFDVHALNTPTDSVSHAHKWLIVGQS